MAVGTSGVGLGRPRPLQLPMFGSSQRRFSRPVGSHHSSTILGSADRGKYGGRREAPTVCDLVVVVEVLIIAELDEMSAEEAERTIWHP